MQKTTEYRIVSCVCVHPFLAHSHAYQGVGMHTVMDLNGWWWWFQWPHPSETNYHLPPFDDRSTWKHHYHQKFQAEANFNQLRGGECWNLKSPGKAEPYPEKWLSKHLGIPPGIFGHARGRGDPTVASEGRITSSLTNPFLSTMRLLWVMELLFLNETAKNLKEETPIASLKNDPRKAEILFMKL